MISLIAEDIIGKVKDEARSVVARNSNIEDILKSDLSASDKLSILGKKAILTAEDNKEILGATGLAGATGLGIYALLKKKK